MGKQLRALYRLAGTSKIKYVKGVVVDDLQEGFVFCDFLNNNSFTISNEELKVVTRSEVESMSFEPNEQSSWSSSEREDYDFGFSIIQNEIQHKHINKAILSRKKVLNKKVGLTELFNQLCDEYTNSHVFLVETPSGNCWIGATPETLLTKLDSGYETMSLAGTKKSLEEEWTEKEYSEQRIVTNAILAELFKFNIDPVISDLETTKAGVVYHLRNLINFETTEPVLKIAKALHPTPAISGSPKLQAISTIKIAENHDREYYCGFGGPINLDGETHLFVNLRCASVSSNQMCLYVGGGITKDSELDKEWDECERKAQSLLRFL